MAVTGVTNRQTRLRATLVRLATCTGIMAAVVALGAPIKWL